MYTIVPNWTYSATDPALHYYVGLDWQDHVEIDARYFRPTEVDLLDADASAARTRLGWDPQVHFHDLVRIMADADLEAASLKPIGDGKRILEKSFGTWHR
jgi:GDPmannose 4,6-dehydratase